MFPETPRKVQMGDVGIDTPRDRPQDDLIHKYGGEAVMYVRAIEKESEPAKSEEKEYRINLTNSGVEAPQTLQDFTEKGMEVKYVEIKTPGLEDVFINLTGKELRD